MLILRLFLIFVLVYYLLKLLGKWLFSGSMKIKSDKSEGKRVNKYSDLTDQTIEDADYEDL